MLRFLLVRVLQSIPVLLVMSLITFIIINAPPGDYGDYIRTNMITQGNASFAAADARGRALPRGARAERPDDGAVFPLDQRHRHPRRLRLSPTSTTGRSRRWSASGCRGRSCSALTCHFLASLFGIGFGILAATRQYSWIDTVLSFISFLGMTIPRFLLALIILYVLAYKLNVQEIGSLLLVAVRRRWPWNWGKFVNLIQHIWPVIFVATMGGLAYNMRVMRANLLDTLNAQYVETARAKGLTEGAVIMKHAVPNALHPLVAYQGVVLPYMLTGEIEVAIVFAPRHDRPGHRRLDVDRRRQRHRNALLLVLGATLIVGNIIADLLLALLDPRIRVGNDA